MKAQEGKWGGLQFGLFGFGSFFLCGFLPLVCSLDCPNDFLSILIKNFAPFLVRFKQVERGVLGQNFLGLIPHRGVGTVVKEEVLEEEKKKKKAQVIEQPPL